MAEKEKKKKRERVVSPVARASFPNLAEPDSGREFSDDKYKITLLFPKAADLKTLKVAVANAAREEWGADVDLKSLLLPFRDGSEKEDTFYHDYVYITAKSSRKPGVINMGKEAINAGDVYGGCFIRANLTPFPYTTTVQVEKDDGKGGTKLVPVEKKGISFALNSVQFVRDGEAFGGSAEKDFEDAAVEDYFPKESESGAADDGDLPF